MKKYKTIGNKINSGLTELSLKKKFNMVLVYVQIVAYTLNCEP